MNSFGGEVLSSEILRDNSKWSQLDLPGFIGRNTKDIREAEIFGFARALHSKYNRVAAIGFCFGGWAVFRLGAKGNEVVDCISTAHPTWLEKTEIENVGVPVQILAPEIDAQFTPELKEFCNQVIPGLGLPYDYQYFPGVEHSFAVRGDEAQPGEKKAMERAKNAAVCWFIEWLHSH